MTPDLDTRRSIRKVTRADFAAYPVWEWALHEEETMGLGESFVRPLELGGLGPDALGQYLVSARVTLSDGSVLPACVEVGIRAGKMQAQPMFIFLQDRHLDFGGAETLTTLAYYTKSPAVYPVSWELAVALAGQTAPLKGKVRRSLFSRIARLFGRSKVPAVLSRV